MHSPKFALEKARVPVCAIWCAAVLSAPLAALELGAPAVVTVAVFAALWTCSSMAINSFKVEPWVIAFAPLWAAGGMIGGLLLRSSLPLSACFLALSAAIAVLAGYQDSEWTACGRTATGCACLGISPFMPQAPWLLLVLPACIGSALAITVPVLFALRWKPLPDSFEPADPHIHYHAALSALTIAASLVIATLLGFYRSYWASITAFVIVGKTFRETEERTLERVGATLVAISMAAAGMAIAPHIRTLLICVFSASCLAAYLVAKRSHFLFWTLQINGVFALLDFIHLPSRLIMVARTENTVLAGVIVLVCAYLTRRLIGWRGSSARKTMRTRVGQPPS